MNAAIIAAGLALGAVLLFVGRRQGRVERGRPAAGQPLGAAAPAPAVEEPAPVPVAVPPLPVENPDIRSPAPLLEARGPGRLGVPGEDSDRVFHQPPDPAAFSEQKLLVVGDGDVAVEAALSLLSRGNEVALVCRGREFVGLKPDNEASIRAAAAAGRLNLHFSSEVRCFATNEAVLFFDDSAGRGELRLPIDRTFVLGA